MRPATSSLLLIFLAAGLLVACSALPASWPPAPFAPAKGLLRPNGVAVAADGSLFIMDSGNHRIAHLAPDGKLLNSIGSFGLKPEQIFHGWDIEIDRDNNLYIANLASDDVGTIHDGAKSFNAAGEFLRQYGRQDYDSNDFDTTSRTPYAIALDNLGRVYVADFNYSQVRLFSPSGELLQTLFEEEEPYPFGGIGDLEVDLPNQRLYMTDFYSAQVVVFDLQIQPSGLLSYTLNAAWGEYGRAAGQFAYPQGIALDAAAGRLYIGDQANRRIEVYNLAGEWLNSIRPPLNQSADPHSPTDWQVIGLEVGPDGALYAVDALNNCIWVFNTAGDFIRQIEVIP